MSTTSPTHQPTLLMYLSLFLCWGIASCVPPGQQQPGQAAPTENYTRPILDLIDAAEDLSIELAEKGLPNVVESWVDDLIVTAQPGSGMPEVGRLKEGERAKYLHQRTLLKKEATLRGQRFKERYLLIEMKSGVMGWVHEGGIRYVYPRFQKVLDQVVSQTNPNQRTRGAEPAVDPAEQRVVVPGVKVGPITKKTSQEALLTLYGGTQVALGVVTTPSGQEECTIIFPGEPSELKITWEDAERTKIKAIYFDRRESTWFTREGVGVGLPLTELTKANKAAIAFYGFNWDYAGTIESWKNGSMGKYKKSFYGVLGPAKSNFSIPSGYQGDRLISSNEAGIESLGLVLTRLVVYLD